jgi:hypothetical protein
MAEIAQIDFTIDGAPAAKTLGELAMKSEQLKTALEGAEIGSKEYGKLNQQLVQTNKQVKNLELGFEALDHEGVASQVGALAGAVGDVTGAMILLGGENENIAQMAANIQMAMGVSMAFKGAIEGASAAMKLFNNVVKANPLLLLVSAVLAVGAGIAALIKYWNDFVGVLVSGRDMVVGILNSVIKFFFGVEEAIITSSMAEKRAHEARVKQQKENAAAHKERLKNIESEKNAIIESADATISALKLEADTMEASGQASDALTIKILEAEKAKTQAVLEANTRKLQSWIEYYQQEAIISGLSEEDYKNQMKARGIPLDEFYKKAQDLLKKNEDDIQYSENRITEFKRELNEERLALAQEAAEKQKAIDDELAAKRKEQYEAELDRLHDLQAQRIGILEEIELVENEFSDARNLSAQDRDINAVREKYFRLIEEANKFGYDTATLEEAQAQAIFEIEEKYRQLDSEAKKKKSEEDEADRLAEVESVKEQAQLLFDTAERAASQIHQNELKRANEKIARGEKLTQKEVNRLNRQAKIEKAFAIARIGQDTALALTGAIAAAQSVPFPGNLIAMAAGVAAVLSGIAQAKAVFADTPDIPSGNINTNSNVPNGDNEQNNNVPVINPVQAGSTFLNSEPIQVYVTEKDISSTQNTVKSIVSEATF